MPVETRSSVDRAVATTGDVITYTVKVDYDPAYAIELPEPGAEIAGFRIIDIGGEEPREEEGRRIEERWYKLRADLVGSYVLPPVQVAYWPAGEDRFALPEASADAAAAAEDPATEEPTNEPASTPATGPQVVQTSEIFIEVESVLGDGEATDIRGLKPLREVVRPTPWWWFAAGGGAVALFGLLGFLLWRRSRREVLVPPRPAHEIAYEALERLRQTDFEDVEAMRLFHFEISEVIRTYVENRFRLNATDLTTEEIVAALDQLRGLSGDESERLRRFLAATDQVKFAAYQPGEEEIAQTYEGALSFVEATRMREVEVPAAEDVAAEDESGEDAGSRKIEEAAA
ncbi:MAG: DUF4381 family protein [Acidobacteriota bacterium]